MEKQNKNKIGLVILLIAIVLFTGAVTYAYFEATVDAQEEKLTVTTGTMKITFADLDGASAVINRSLELGGAPIVKEFKIENTGTEEVTTNILWHNLINTYMYRSLSYSLYSATTADKAYGTTPIKTGNVPQSKVLSDKTLAEVTIPGETTHYYKLEIKLEYLEDVDQTSDINAKLVTNFTAGNATVEMVPSIVTSIVENKTPTQYVKTGAPTFTNLATTDETADGLYVANDDYKKTYYFRGASENNYVKFANKYWRIIRINGDGSVRMIYDGTTAHKNGEASTDRVTLTGQAWISAKDDAKYVGWMYGGDKGAPSDDKGPNYEDTTKVYAQNNETNSDIKTVVDDWYDTNLASYDTYIADAVYCNDRSTPGSDWSADTKLGYGKNATAYGGASRLVDTSDWRGPKANAQPVFTCPQKNDAFTVSDSVHGNAMGTEKSRKIGLITVDEIVAAGGRFYEDDGSSNNNNYYLYKGSWYWSLSPRYFIGSPAYVFNVNSNGNLHNGNVSGTDGAVAPVISLKAEHAKQFEGYGTLEAPYQLPGVQ